MPNRGVLWEGTGWDPTGVWHWAHLTRDTRNPHSTRPPHSSKASPLPHIPATQGHGQHRVAELAGLRPLPVPRHVAAPAVQRPRPRLLFRLLPPHVRPARLGDAELPAGGLFVHQRSDQPSGHFDGTAKSFLFGEVMYFFQKNTGLTAVLVCILFHSNKTSFPKHFSSVASHPPFRLAVFIRYPILRCFTFASHMDGVRLRSAPSVHPYVGVLPSTPLPHWNNSSSISFPDILVVSSVHM